MRFTEAFFFMVEPLYKRFLGDPLPLSMVNGGVFPDRWFAAFRIRLYLEMPLYNFMCPSISSPVSFCVQVATSALETHIESRNLNVLQ